MPICKSFPYSTYIRLLFPTLFEKLNKIIYLDGDTIVLKDLLSMYNINIDKYYFVGQYSNGINHEKFFKYSKHYINAGVLLINLLQQRKDKTEKKILNWAEQNKKYLTLQDQTIINYCFIDKVGLLPPEYGIFSNSFEFYVNRTKNFTLGKFNRIEYEKAYNEPSIVHFYGTNKPWKKNGEGRYYWNQWWENAKFSGIYNILLNRYKKEKFFGIIIYNNNDNLNNYLYYFGQIKLLSYFKYIHFINNENIDKYKGKQIKVLINKIIDNKIPSKNITPIFISFEIDKIFDNIKILEYLKKYQPIGCKNYFTLNYLLKNKIKSYYIGNYLTLLGYKNKKNKRNNKIYLDFNISSYLIIYKDLIEIFEQYENEEYIFFKNNFNLFTIENKKFKFAEDLINNFSYAKLVITNNINIAYICHGLKTPVILMINNIEKYNFENLYKIFNLYTLYNNKLIENFIFDKNQHIINKYMDEKILNIIEKKFKEFIS